jgi:hypothetical protein
VFGLFGRQTLTLAGIDRLRQLIRTFPAAFWSRSHRRRDSAALFSKSWQAVRVGTHDLSLSNGVRAPRRSSLKSVAWVVGRVLANSCRLKPSVRREVRVHARQRVTPTRGVCAWWTQMGRRLPRDVLGPNGTIIGAAAELVASPVC